LLRKATKLCCKSKQGISFFSKKIIENAVEGALGGLWIILESIHEGNPLIAIGCCYSTCTALHFVETKDAGSTAKGLCLTL
jgi:hypothetical protein